MDALLSLIPGGSLTAIGAAAVAVLGIAWSLIRTGRKLERGKIDRAQVDALEERLEMNREATAAEREAAAMSDEEARKEALKWSRD